MPDHIPPSVIRRVNRVRLRANPGFEEPDEILDDVVLWRAFEATWSEVGTERRQAEEAVADTIAAHGVAAFPTVAALVDALRAFGAASSAEVAEWFRSDRDSADVVRARVRSAVRGLRDALAGDRWGRPESRDLARLMYDMRSAVMHARLDTYNSLALPVLPRLREALIELTIARAAACYALPLAEVRRHFDRALAGAGAAAPA